MKNLLFVAAAICFMTVLNSCGTIKNASKKGKTEVFLINGPKDLRVSSNGQSLSIESEVFAASGHTDGSTTAFYTSAVNLPSKKKAVLELYSPSSGKKASVTVRPRLWGKMVVVDMLLTAGIGLLVDIPTGNIRTLKPRLIDVENALAGKPRSKWKSQGKLKRMTKRKIKKG